MAATLGSKWDYPVLQIRLGVRALKDLVWHKMVKKTHFVPPNSWSFCLTVWIDLTDTLHPGVGWGMVVSLAAPLSVVSLGDLGGLSKSVVLSLPNVVTDPLI